MPKKVLPSYFAYIGFTHSLKTLKAFKIGSAEEERYLQRHNISLDNPPRSQDFQDDVYIYYNLNGYRVKIRTTITTKPFRVADRDAAWVIIENERGKAVMYSQPIHRTKNFLPNLLAQFKIFQKIVQNRPICRCGADMNIKKYDIRTYRLQCSMDSIAIDHDSPIEVYEFIRPKLSKKLYNFLTRKQSKERYSRNKAKKVGKIFGSAAIKRIKWSHN